MELVFEAQSIDYLRPVFTKAAAPAQTQELIVQDSYPDCGRIVFTGACAVMRGKEARDGSVVVTGGVRAGPVSYTHLDVYKRQFPMGLTPSPRYVLPEWFSKPTTVVPSSSQVYM